MGIYNDSIFPYLLDWAMGSEHFKPLRTELLAKAHGVTVEIGFGTGANLPYYGKAVTELTAIEKVPRILQRAESRIGKCTFPVKKIVASCEKLPIESKSTDCVVSTFTLCSCADAFKTLQEIRRILKPGGEYLFLEHGLSPDHSVQRWQKRLTPLQRKVAGGCHLDRNIRSLLADACLDAAESRSFYVKRMPKISGYVTMGSLVA